MISQSLRSAKYGMCQELANNTWGDTHVTVAVTPVSFVHVQGGYFGTTHVLGEHCLASSTGKGSHEGGQLCVPAIVITETIFKHGQAFAMPKHGLIRSKGKCHTY